MDKKGFSWKRLIRKDHRPAIRFQRDTINRKDPDFNVRDMIFGGPKILLKFVVQDIYIFLLKEMKSISNMN